MENVEKQLIFTSKYDKIEILKLFRDGDFKDTFVDSYIKKISIKLSKKIGSKIDPFSDDVFLNTYINFKNLNGIELVSLSFQDVADLNELEELEFNEKIQSFESVLEDSIVLEIVVHISENSKKLTESIEKCEFINNKITYADIKWIGFTEDYNKDFPPANEIRNRPRLQLYIDLDKLVRPEDIDIKKLITFFNILLKKYYILFPDNLEYFISENQYHMNIDLFLENDIIEKLKKLKLLNKIYLSDVVKLIKVGAKNGKCRKTTRKCK